MSRVAYSPDGTLIAAGDCAGYLRIWEANTGRVVMRPSEYEPGAAVTSIDFSPDGQFLLTAGGSGPYSLTTKLWVWDVRSGQLVAVLRGAAPATTASFSPDGKSVLTVDEDGTACIYSVAQCGSIDDLIDLAQRRMTPSPVPR
jgi:WD40 repeat protein